MRPSPVPRARVVVRARRSCAASSRASAASSARASRFMALRRQSQAREALPVARDLRVAGGEELLAVENGVGAGEEAQGLQLIAHALAPGGQAYVGARHQ